MCPGLLRKALGLLIGFDIKGTILGEVPGVPNEVLMLVVGRNSSSDEEVSV